MPGGGAAGAGAGAGWAGVLGSAETVGAAPGPGKDIDVTIRLSDPAEANGLLDSTEYAAIAV